MYQLEVKRWLVEHLFHPELGWVVHVDIDAMEQAKGPQHPTDKRAKVENAEKALVKLGVTVGAHPKYGRADIVASHKTKGTALVEVEGNSSRQKEQAMYSALGQVILMMKPESINYAIAFPDEPSWEAQVLKIPSHIKKSLNLCCLLVSNTKVRNI